jgi:hypothetical protein
MKITLILLSLLISSGAFAQHLVRDLIKAGTHRSEFSSFFGESCYQELKTFYGQGEMLVSDILVRESFPIADLAKIDENLDIVRTEITKTKEDYFTFFHYTNATSLAEDFRPSETNRDKAHSEIKTKVFDDIMTFLKNPGRGNFFNPSFPSINKAFLYVSSCPTCSSSFGNIQLSFTFSSKARVINIIPYFDWSAVIRELKSRYPEVFSECDFKRMGLLALEDSGIDIIRYATNWYQVTNLYDVINSDVLVFPKAGYGSADDATKERSHNRTYTLSLDGRVPGIPDPVAAPEPEVEMAAIQVIEASWITHDDSLSNATKFCNGKETCTYRVHEKDLPGVKYKRRRPKSFTIKWKCLKDGDVQSHTISSDARGEEYTLDCR